MNPEPAGRGGVRRALATSFAHRYTAFLIRAVSLPILARLLSPEDYGAFALVWGLVLFAQVLGDLGGGAYLVHTPELTASRLGTAATLSGIFCFILAGLFLIAGAPAADLLGAPQISPLLGVAALSILAQPIVSIANALLQRRMAFGRILVIGLANELATAATSITLALNGFGAMSLVWGVAAGAAAGAIAAAPSLRLAPHRPRFEASEVRPQLAFGLNAITANSAGVVGDYLCQIGVARGLGLPAAGVFNRATSLLGIVNQAMLMAAKPVALASLSAHSARGADLAGPYLAKTEFLSAATWPGAAALMILSPEIVRIALGPDWDAAATPLAILGATLLLLPITGMNFEFYAASGIIRKLPAQEALTQGSRAGLAWLGARVSLEAAAAGAVLGRLPNLLLTVVQLAPALGLRRLAIFAALRKAGLLAAGVGLATWSAAHLAREAALPALATFLIALACAGPVWLALLFLLRHPAAAELHALARGGLKLLR